MRQWIGSASTAEEAIEKGLKTLGLKRDQAEWAVLGEKTSALLSMMGFKRVKVKLTEKPGTVRTGERSGERPGGQNRREDRSGGRWQRDGGGEDRRHRFDHNRRNGRAGNGRDRGRGPDDFIEGGQRAPRPEAAKMERPPKPEHNQRPERNQRPPRGEQNQRFARQPRPGQDRPPVSNEAPRPSFSPASQTPPLAPLAREALGVEQLLALWKERLWPDLEWSMANTEKGEPQVTLTTANTEKLLGPGGETLESFERLFNTVLLQHDEQAPRVTFAVPGFQKAGEQDLVEIAKHAAAEVKSTGLPWRLDPMGSAERKIIHQALAGDPDVETVSEGEGPYRKVVVRPKTRG